MHHVVGFTVRVGRIFGFCVYGGHVTLGAKLFLQLNIALVESNIN